MEVIDKILNEWSFRCHDGIVDMNNPKKIAILNEILIEEGIDDDIVDAVLNLPKEDPSSEEKKQKALAVLTGATSETGISDAVAALNDEEKQKVLKYINNKFKEELKDYSELEKKIENKIGNPDAADLISAAAIKRGEDDKLLEYLSSPDEQLSFELGQKTGDLLNILKPTNLNPNFLTRIIKFKPSEGGKALGVGEIALELFFKNAKKASTGDINIGGNLVELKGEAARFASKNSTATGRDGNIDRIRKDLKTETGYPGEPPSDFSTYIREILNLPNKEKNLKYVNDILNKIYTDTTSIEISLEDDRNKIYEKLIKKYLLGYVSAYKENNYYMLISNDPPFNYTLYTPQELINNSDILSFTNITTSAFPNLLLGKDKKEKPKLSAPEKAQQTAKEKEKEIDQEIAEEPEAKELKQKLDQAEIKLKDKKKEEPNRQFKFLEDELERAKIEYNDYVKKRKEELSRVREDLTEELTNYLIKSFTEE